MLSIASQFGVGGAPILHDTAKVRASFTCTSTVCKGVDTLTSQWFGFMQEQLNRVGNLFYGVSWKPLVVDGLLGAKTLAAAQMIFPKVPVLDRNGYGTPTSKEILALWIRGLDFADDTDFLFLHTQLAKMVDQRPVTQPLVAVAAPPPQTAPVPPQTAPAPGIRPSGVTSVPTGATATGSAPTQSSVTHPVLTMQLPPAQQASFLPVAGMSTTTKVAIGVGVGVGVLGILAVALRR